jgi:uncharacterized membrane protein YphA (DoxX/SURF4 family)
MKGKTIAYWITTGLVALAFLSGGVFDAIQAPQAVEIIKHLGYPAYFASIIGVWKVVGAIAILLPRFPVLKEWAYAGFLFDLTGAAASHIAVGDGAKDILTPVILLGVVAASWALRPESRRLRRA